MKKKLIAFVLSAIMVFGTAVPVSAAASEQPDAETNQTMSAYPYSKYVFTGYRNGRETVYTLDCNTEVKTGSTGNAVRLLQSLLNAHNYYVGKPDGKFGDKTSKTYNQLRKFKADRGMTVSGKTGPKTWNALILEWEWMGCPVLFWD